MVLPKGQSHFGILSFREAWTFLCTALKFTLQRGFHVNLMLDFQGGIYFQAEFSAFASAYLEK